MRDAELLEGARVRLEPIGPERARALLAGRPEPGLGWEEGFPLAPLILGFILGDQIELNLVRAIMTDSNPWLFVTRPISGALLLASVLSVAAAIWQHLRHQARIKDEEEPDF